MCKFVNNQTKYVYTKFLELIALFHSFSSVQMTIYSLTKHKSIDNILFEFIFTGGLLCEKNYYTASCVSLLRQC